MFSIWFTRGRNTIVKVHEIPKCVRPNHQFLATLSGKMDITLPEQLDGKTIRVFVHLQHNKEMWTVEYILNSFSKQNKIRISHSFLSQLLTQQQHTADSNDYFERAILPILTTRKIWTNHYSYDRLSQLASNTKSWQDASALRLRENGLCTWTARCPIRMGVEYPSLKKEIIITKTIF